MAWIGIIGGISTIVEYVNEKNPTLHNKIRPYIKGSELFPYKGHKIDLSHLAATTLGYVYGKLVPRFWTGWVGDLATTMRDIQARKNNFPSNVVGTDQEAADFIIGHPECQFPVADIEADADSIHFSSALKSSTIDYLLEKYYSTGYSSKKSLYISDINKIYSECNHGGAISLADKIYFIMNSDQGFDHPNEIADFALSKFAMYHLGMPSISEKRAICNAFVKYIENKL